MPELSAMRPHSSTSGHGTPAPATRHHRLTFPQLDREIVAEPGETIFQSARRSGLRIVGACGGRGACGTCTVQIMDGEVQHIDGRVLAPRTARKGQPPRSRWIRACQVLPRADCTIEVEPRSLAPVVRAEAEPQGRELLALDPAVAGVDLSVPAATLEDPLCDADRLLRAAARPWTALDIEAARQLPAVLRSGDWTLNVRLHGSEAIGFSQAGAPLLGLAVDLGTTNVAGFLIDLRTGARLASLGIENPQVAWGADVVSRINHAMRDAASAEHLRNAAIAAINAIAHDLAQAVGASTADIVDVAVCGNTAMHHLLAGLPVRQLGRAPFVAATREAMDAKARDLGLSVCPGAYIHLAPNIGGFVGGDHVTALLATEPKWSQLASAMVVDIGTNTEISLIRGGEIVTASCPSGPALEGGHIACGMRAAGGAVERVVVKDGRLQLAVIGGGKPVGICGSGVIDTVAALREAGELNDAGRLAAGHPDVAEIRGQRAAILATDIYFTQHDIRAVQLAKSAIRTGMDLLLKHMGLAEPKLERVIIAGAFGADIDIKSAIAIGLLPDLPPERFEQVGNAAGLGIRQMLASKDARARAAELASRCRYVELSTRSEFQKTFMHNIGFRRAS
jgi:uncharacterized 2Fe-2S/4Fe-4S cluster protein (DUF4445 family)